MNKKMTQTRRTYAKGERTKKRRRKEVPNPSMNMRKCKEKKICKANRQTNAKDRLNLK